MTNQVLAVLKARSPASATFPLSAAAGSPELIAERKGTGLNKQMADEVFDQMLADGRRREGGDRQAGHQGGRDEGELVEIVRRAIAANPKAVADYKKGKTAAANAIKGAVMSETKGTAQPDLVQKILEEELQKA